MVSDTSSSHGSPGAARWIVAILSAIVFSAVALVLYITPASGASSGPSLLATVNAALNALSAVLLVTGFVFIKRKRIAAHRTCMLSAFGVSALFLVTYLVHHAKVGSVPFQGEGIIRVVYFGILIGHILLAVAIVPLALLTVQRAWTGRIARHRRIARWTLPTWLYVSLSGVAVYFMLYHL